MFRLRSLVPQQIFAAVWLPSVCKEWDNLWGRFKFICTRILSTVGGQSAVAVLFEQKHNRCHYDFLYGPTCKSWGSSSARSHASFVRRSCVSFPVGGTLFWGWKESGGMVTRCHFSAQDWPISRIMSFFQKESQGNCLWATFSFTLGPKIFFCWDFFNSRNGSLKSFKGSHHPMVMISRNSKFVFFWKEVWRSETQVIFDTSWQYLSIYVRTRWEIWCFRHLVVRGWVRAGGGGWVGDRWHIARQCEYLVRAWASVSGEWFQGLTDPADDAPPLRDNWQIAPKMGTMTAEKVLSKICKKQLVKKLIGKGNWVEQPLPSFSSAIVINRTKLSS